MGAENLAPHRDRSPDHPARRESLYRLHYPGPPCLGVFAINTLQGSLKSLFQSSIANPPPNLKLA
jgi:hypothetical protein